MSPATQYSVHLLIISKAVCYSSMLIIQKTCKNQRDQGNKETAGEKVQEEEYSIYV